MFAKTTKDQVGSLLAIQQPFQRNGQTDFKYLYIVIGSACLPPHPHEQLATSWQTMPILTCSQFCKCIFSAFAQQSGCAFYDTSMRFGTSTQFDTLNTIRDRPQSENASKSYFQNGVLCTIEEWAKYPSLKIAFGVCFSLGLLSIVFSISNYIRIPIFIFVA